MKSVASPKLRAVPVAILQRLGLIDQALPLSNFYYKIRLCEGVTDLTFTSTITDYNKAINEYLYHSLYNGDITFSLSPHPKKVPKVFVSKPFFVVDCPPFSVTEEDVRAYLSAGHATDISVRSAEGPCGTCFVIQCILPPPPLTQLPLFLTANSTHASIMPHSHEVIGSTQEKETHLKTHF